MKSLSHVQLCDPMGWSRPVSSAHGFSRQEYWRGLPFPSSISAFFWESLAGTMESTVVPYHPCPKLLSTPQNNFFGPREDCGEVCLILCLKPGSLKSPRRESLLIQWNSCGRISATTFCLQQSDFFFFFLQCGFWVLLDQFRSIDDWGKGVSAFLYHLGLYCP